MVSLRRIASCKYIGIGLGKCGWRETCGDLRGLLVHLVMSMTFSRQQMISRLLLSLNTSVLVLFF